jgi:hypothetical protein
VTIFTVSRASLTPRVRDLADLAARDVEEACTVRSDGAELEAARPAAPGERVECEHAFRVELVKPVGYKPEVRPLGKEVA